MTIDEAITHAREVAEKLREKAKLMREGNKNGLFYPKDFEDCETCASEHEQLAKWLEELKAYKACPLMENECYYCRADKCHNGGQKIET